MDLWTLRVAIGETSAEDWHQLEHGPYFHDGFAGGKGQLEHQGHGERAVLIADLDVALEWGLSLDDDHEKATAEDYGWDFTFANPSVRREFIDVFYRGQLVDRIPVLVVDGGRGMLPDAEQVDDRWVVRGWVRDLVALVDELRGGRDFVHHFSRTGWAVLR